MEIPPGIIYLVQRLPRILTPPVLVYIVNFVCQSHLGIQLPNWVLPFSYALCFPTALAVTVLYRDIINSREAAALGAVLPPAVGGSSPSGIMFLFNALRDVKSGYPGDALSRRCKEIGYYTMNIRVMFENRMFTAEPEHIKAMLATQFDEFEKGQQACNLLHSLLGTGVFASDGDMWKFHRAMTRPFFSKDRITHFDIFDRHAEDAISQFKVRLQQGYPVDFQDLASRFTLDSATEFLFGTDVLSLSAGLPYPFYSPLSQSSSASKHPANVFARAFAEGQRIASFRIGYADNWPLFEFWRDQSKKHMAIIHKFIDPILTEAVTKKRAARELEGKVTTKEVMGDRDVKDGETLLDHLVNYTEDHIILRDEILNIMIAGRDTTASTLTFTVYMLAEHPDVLLRLRKEILRKVGTYRRPTYDDFRDMKYLRAVINALSISGPPRKGTTWPSITPNGKPLYIPPNTKAPYSVFLMHRWTDLWGPDALEFDPDRFLDERLHKYLTPNPFIFLPFNAGPRICLGQQFAYHEVSFFLVRLLQSFSAISLATDAQPPSSRPPASWAKEGGRKAKDKICLKTHLTMYVAEGLWVRMEEASAVEVV